MLRGPGFWQWDQSFVRGFELATGHRIELRAEAINLTNQFNRGNPSAALNNAATFGRITDGRGHAADLAVRASSTRSDETANPVARYARAAACLHVVPGSRGGGTRVLAARAGEAVRVRGCPAQADTVGHSRGRRHSSEAVGGPLLALGLFALGPFGFGGGCFPCVGAAWILSVANGGEEATLNAFIFLWLAAAGAGVLQPRRRPRAPSSA